MNNQQQLAADVLQCLEGQTTQNCVQVLGNVFLQLGLSGMGVKEKVSEKEVLDIVLKDIEKNGETITNALTRQGLIILSWINKETI